MDLSWVNPEKLRPIRSEADVRRIFITGKRLTETLQIVKKFLEVFEDCSDGQRFGSHIGHRLCARLGQ